MFAVKMIGIMVFACSRLWHKRVIVWVEWMGRGELQPWQPSLPALLLSHNPSPPSNRRPESKSILLPKLTHSGSAMYWSSTQTVLLTSLNSLNSSHCCILQYPFWALVGSYACCLLDLWDLKWILFSTPTLPSPPSHAAQWDVIREADSPVLSYHCQIHNWLPGITFPACHWDWRSSLLSVCPAEATEAAAPLVI